MWEQCWIEVLSKYSQHQNFQYRYLSCLRKVCNKNNTPEISSDVSEVFDWSALEMLSTPESPISFTVVCERCLAKK